MTECQHCHFESPRPCSFLELELSIADTDSLQDALRSFQAREELSGSNQYACNQCQCKRDALRYTRLENLPPVLNIQLLRFVFDLKTLSKKKLKKKVRFPLTLDMSEFVHNGPRKEGFVYDLKAVLLHRGSSADSGHYVSRIRDEK